MCGINGIAFSSGSKKQINKAMLAAMRDVILHRGPDDAGLFAAGNVGLGHRRLAIVDVAHGQQPMFNQDKSCVIVYNGEVYNHADYRAALEAKGCEFQTHCDTETILHLYEKYGAKCVDYLRGMFAFAVWDDRKKELFIARDRLGVKPLYYVHDADGNLFFASEIKAILETKAVTPELNYAALPDYLANHATCGDETLFANVKRLPAGHTLTWKDGAIRLEKFWDLQFEPKLNGAKRSDQDWTAEWFELFQKAVEMRLMADVPLGMFLSGGIDSSAIAAVMSKLVAEPIKTFSVAFAEREANEFEFARLVAAAFKTEHHEIIVSPEEFFAALPKLIWHEDEPLAHPSSVALNFVSQLASQHVKVVLTGEGSDETLAGYGRYAKTLLNLKYGETYHKFAPKSAREFVAERIENLPLDSKVRHKLRKSFFSIEPNIENIYFDNFAVFPRKMQSEMLSDETRARIGSHINPYAAMQGFFDSAETTNLLDRMLYADTKTYLHELLMKQDQMSMAASIESRVPFLDHKLMEFSARMPDNLKLRGKTTKFVLREAMRGILPDEILTRKKMGFPVPIGKWFRNEYKHLIDEFVLSERALSRGIFKADFIRNLVERHRKGENHDERLWALLNFEIWQRQFLENEK
ncbi:MAG: asparagine synthase (glutamine-hydrolyzing) [Pyrinomonadaceae bacterium]|nr:asparagine synthase (glutamine-hydrolyzing) [Pyrinomonadaceae bacterium]